MLSFISHPRSAPAALIGVALVIATGGCGSDSKSGSSSERSSAGAAAGPEVQGRADASKLTCSHLANPANFAVAYDAAFDLAGRTRVTDGSTQQVASRIYAAMSDLCEKRSDPSYRPVEDAVDAVKSGGYEIRSTLR
jgi:hypothetical protein